MNKLKFSFLLVCMVACFWSCDGSYKMENILAEAEALVDQYPDSVYNILKNIEDADQFEEPLYCKYALLYVQAKNKGKHDSITNDTIVFRARDYYTKVGDNKYSALASFYAARVLKMQKKEIQAFPVYLEAADYAAKTDDNNLKGMIQFDLGALYRSQLLIEKSPDHFRKAAIYFDKAGKPANVMLAYGQLAACFSFYKQQDSSLYYYNKGLDIARQLNDSLEQGYLLRNIGVLYLRTDNPDLGRQYSREAINYITDGESKARAYANIAQTFDVVNNRDSVSYYIEQAKLQLRKQKDPNNSAFLALYKLQSKVNEEAGDYKLALTYYKDYVSLVDTILTETGKNEVLLLEKKYNFEVMKNENNRLLIQRQYTMIIALMLVLVVFAMGFILYRKHTRSKTALLSAHQKIYQLKDLAESFDEEKDSFRNILLKHFDILKKAALLEGYLREEEKIQGQKLLKKFNETVYGQETFDWDSLIEAMNHLYDGFPDFLKKEYPELDDVEFKICCLTYAKLNNTEIAIIIGLSVNTIQAKKTYLRKKLNIGGYGNITDFFERKYDKK